LVKGTELKLEVEMQRSRGSGFVKHRVHYGLSFGIKAEGRVGGLGFNRMGLILSMLTPGSMVLDTEHLPPTS
jgi:hypothetical protein